MDTNESEVMPTARDADPVGKHSVTVLSPQLQNYYNKKLLQAIRNGDGNLKDLFKEFESIKKLTRIEINSTLEKFGTQTMDFLDTQMKDEHHLGIMEWLKVLEDMNVANETNNELAFAFKLIGLTEQQPRSTICGGIDLSVLYTNLSSMMLGLPLTQMNQQTEQFLLHCFKELTSESITNNDLSESLQQFIEDPEQFEMAKTIPTQIDFHKVLEKESLNPLKIPVETLRIFEN